MDPEALKLYERWGEALFDATWFGNTAAKNPGDAWIYQELIFRNKPELIIECGAFKGGGALYLAHLLDLLGRPEGEVISIDKTPYSKVKHPRITWLHGDTVQPDIVDLIKMRAKGKTVMIILDSDHEATHVKKELAAYANLVSSGQYLIVEDTWWRWNTGGPHEAVEEFLAHRQDFEIDKSCERYIITNNPGGFLKRTGRSFS